MMPSRGPCAKRRVECRIESDHPSGETEYVIGNNDCDNPQSSCPRLPGEDYAKCKTICRQGAHAEIHALALASKVGINVTGGRAIITGHHWVCAPCGLALRDAGIKNIEIRLRDDAT